MNKKTKKIVLAVELALLVIISAFVVSLFYNNSSTGSERQLPIASIYTDTNSGEAPLEVSFSAEGIGKDGAVYSYNWDFGDFSNSNIKNPKHLFEKEGEYIVCLTIKDNYGEEEKDHITISVEESSLKAKARNDATFSGNKKAPKWVHFYGSAEGGKPPYTYHWEFFGFNILTKDWKWESDEQHPDRVCWREGHYSATLTVTDSDGNSDTAETSFWLEQNEKIIEYLMDIIGILSEYSK